MHVCMSTSVHTADTIHYTSYILLFTYLWMYIRIIKGNYCCVSLLFPFLSLFTSSRTYPTISSSSKWTIGKNKAPKRERERGRLKIINSLFHCLFTRRTLCIIHNIHGLYTASSFSFWWRCRYHHRFRKE